MSRRLTQCAIATVCATVAGYAVAQRATPRAVLHEDMPSPGRRSTPSPLVGSAAPNHNPDAIFAGDKTLPEPTDTGTTPKRGEPVMGTDSVAADRSTEEKPDLNTGSDGTLHYASVFNPDVVPFKRMSALDAVRDDYTMIIAHQALSEVPVGGATDATRDRFWGSLLVNLKPGIDIPLPSVAPDMRILSVESTPKIALHFSKDGADNYYVRSDESNASGVYRLRFLADADAGYFAPSLPQKRRYTVKDVRDATPANLLAAVPSHALSAANKTIRKLGLDSSLELGSAFNKLVSYFRAFAAKDRPSNSGDIYRDLVDAQAGVCRHRSFAFMVTANALGIATRYVSNEAHAFVEVWFPERGWQRIDLGGAALRLEVENMENKTIHRPRADDPFAKPEAYKENYTQLAGDIAGVTDQQLRDKRRSLDEAPSSGAFGARGGDGTGSGSGGKGNDSASSDPQDHITPDQDLPASAQDPKRLSPQLVVNVADTSVYRGQTISVQGSIAVGGNPLPDRMIEIFVSPSGNRGKNAVSLGRVVSDRNGHFEAKLTVPGEVQLRRHEIFASSPPDAKYNAALSR
jgi:hypothetical protein